MASQKKDTFSSLNLKNELKEIEGEMHCPLLHLHKETKKTTTIKYIKTLDIVCSTLHQCQPHKEKAGCAGVNKHFTVVLE